MEPEQRTNVFDELLIEDNKLLNEFGNASHDHKKILDIFSRRVTLYKKYADRETDPIIRAIIEAKKSVIMSDMGLPSTQYDIQGNITKIISRLDIIEKKISRIQGRESS
ncbi:MAG: hypothetical protein WBL46_10290 [Nitrososphaeraceae archaeon]